MFRKFLKKPTAESDLPTESDLPAESDLLFKDATKDQLFDSIIKENSYVILREAISSEKIDYFRKYLQPHASKYWHDIDMAVLDDEKLRSKLSLTHEIPDKGFFEVLLAQDAISESMFRHAHDYKNSYFDLISFPAFWSLLYDAFPNCSFSVSNASHTRKMHPQVSISDFLEGNKHADGEEWGLPTEYHSDIFYHATTQLVLNIWIPFSNAGLKYKAPSLEIIKVGLERSQSYLDYYVTDGVVKIEYEKYDPKNIHKEFDDKQRDFLNVKKGDIAIFSNWTIHRTHITPDMTSGRESLELRLVDQKEDFCKKYI